MKLHRRLSISVFYPFLNDWGTIGSLVALAADTLQQITDDWEIIIVDDGSRQKDHEALQAVVRQIDGCRIVRHEKNKGYGGALQTGFREAKKDLVFYTDGDAQYDVREMVKLVDVMVKCSPLVGMVNGYKIKRHDPWHRVVAGKFYHYVVKFFFRIPIRDTDCDFRLLRREVLRLIHLRETTGTICIELVKSVEQAGFEIKEVPVHHFWRFSGKSQFFNVVRLWKTFLGLFHLWWRLMVQKQYAS